MMGHESTKTEAQASTRSRRALLAAAAGGVAATVVSGLGRVAPASANTGDPFVLGQNNQADTVTGLQNVAGGSTAIGLGAFSFGTGLVGQGFAVGVYGTSTIDADSVGVKGESRAGRGVNGISYSGAGVHGKSELGNGISGLAPSYGGNGVYGENTGGGVGVYGVSASVAGIGVYGDALRGSGVVGNSENDIGVQAISPNGTALQAQGRVAFSTSGLESVPTGASQVTVAPGTSIQETTIVLCTLECSQAGISIDRLTKDTSANAFKVFLSKKVASGESAKVAWFVIG